MTKQEYAKKWGQDHKEAKRKIDHKYKSKNRQKLSDYSVHYYRLKRYGVSLPTVSNILRKQNGKCAICDDQLTLKSPVDHDHISGQIRGLLCHHCNRGIGSLQEDPEILRRAIIYLQGE